MQHERKMHADERNAKDDACKRIQTERNMKSCRSTLGTNKTIPRSVRQPVLKWILGDFVPRLDHGFADFHKTLESDRLPHQSDDHDNSNYSDAKDFDWSSHVIPT